MVGFRDGQVKELPEVGDPKEEGEEEAAEDLKKMGNDALLPHALFLSPSLSLSNLFRCSLIGSGGLSGPFVGPGGFCFWAGLFS